MCVYGYIIDTYTHFSHRLNLVCVNQGRTSETLTTSACRQCVSLYSHCWIQVSGVPPDDCLRQHLVGCLLPAVVSTEWTLAQLCSGCNTEVWSTSGPPLAPPPSQYHHSPVHRWNRKALRLFGAFYSCCCFTQDPRFTVCSSWSVSEGLTKLLFHPKQAPVSTNSHFYFLDDVHFTKKVSVKLGLVFRAAQNK